MIDQLGIALTGVTALFLTQCKSEKLRRYACLFGCAAQPFWFYSAITAEQWGIVFLNTLYSAAWLKGLWMHWLQPWVEARELERLRAEARNNRLMTPMMSDEAFDQWLTDYNREKLS